MVTEQPSLERSRHVDARRDRRAHIPNVSVSYEAEPGRFVCGDALEVSERGVFICATRPVPARSLLEVEIRVLGEPPIFAVGRVAWTREVGQGQGRPSGMGVKLIDLEDDARALIARLVSGRQPTMYGIGEPAVDPAYAAPVVVRAMEASIPFDLVTRKVMPVSRAPLRARVVVARVLAAAVLVGFVVGGVRDSRVGVRDGHDVGGGAVAAR